MPVATQEEGMKALRHLANGTLAMYRVDRPVTWRKRTREEVPIELRQTQIDEAWMRADKVKEEERGRNVHSDHEVQREDEGMDRNARDRRDFDTRHYDG